MQGSNAHAVLYKLPSTHQPQVSTLYVSCPPAGSALRCRSHQYIHARDTCLYVVVLSATLTAALKPGCSSSIFATQAAPAFAYGAQHTSSGTSDTYNKKGGGSRWDVKQPATSCQPFFCSCTAKDDTDYEHINTAGCRPPGHWTHEVCMACHRLQHRPAPPCALSVPSARCRGAAHRAAQSCGRRTLR